MAVSTSNYLYLLITYNNIFEIIIQHDHYQTKITLYLNLIHYSNSLSIFLLHYKYDLLYNFSISYILFNF